jgi:hypothetical protein
MTISHSLHIKHPSNTVEYKHYLDSLLALIAKLETDKHLLEFNDLSYITILVSDGSAVAGKPLEVYIYGDIKTARNLEAAGIYLNKSLPFAIHIHTDPYFSCTESDLSISFSDNLFTDENQEHIFFICKTLILGASSAMRLGKKDKIPKFTLITKS